MQFNDWLKLVLMTDKYTACLRLSLVMVIFGQMEPYITDKLHVQIYTEKNDIINLKYTTNIINIVAGLQ